MADDPINPWGDVTANALITEALDLLRSQPGGAGPTWLARHLALKRAVEVWREHPTASLADLLTLRPELSPREAFRDLIRRELFDALQARLWSEFAPLVDAPASPLVFVGTVEWEGDDVPVFAPPDSPLAAMKVISGRHWIEDPDDPAPGAVCAGCGGTRWNRDENWSPEYPEVFARHGHQYEPRDGLIPCGACSLGEWDAPWPPVGMTRRMVSTALGIRESDLKEVPSTVETPDGLLADADMDEREPGSADSPGLPLMTRMPADGRPRCPYGDPLSGVCEAILDMSGDATGYAYVCPDHGRVAVLPEPWTPEAMFEAERVVFDPDHRESLMVRAEVAPGYPVACWSCGTVVTVPVIASGCLDRSVLSGWATSPEADRPRCPECCKRYGDVENLDQPRVMAPGSWRPA